MSDTEIVLQTHYQPDFNYAKLSGQRAKHEKPGERHLRYLAGDPVHREEATQEEVLAMREKFGRVQFICRHSVTGIHRISTIHHGAEVYDMLEANRKALLHSWDLKRKASTICKRSNTPIETMREMVGPRQVRELLGFMPGVRPTWDIIDQRPVTWDTPVLPGKTWNQAFICRFLLDNYPDRYAVKKKQYMGVVVDLKLPQGYRMLESVLEMKRLMPVK